MLSVLFDVADAAGIFPDSYRTSARSSAASNLDSESVPFRCCRDGYFNPT